MSCFLSAVTPSRLSCCTGVNLLFLGSGIRSCWAWAGKPPDIRDKPRDKARTEGARTLANGERMGFQILEPWPSCLHHGPQGSSSAFQLDRKTLSQVGPICFWIACHLSCCCLHPSDC